MQQFFEQEALDAAAADGISDDEEEAPPWVEQFLEDEAACGDHAADSSTDDEEPTASDLAWCGVPPFLLYTRGPTNKRTDFFVLFPFFKGGERERATYGRP